jgi:hypothetical protein
MRSIQFGVYCGVDLGKTRHHIVALDGDGKRLFDRGVDNSERALRAVLDNVSGHGRTLVVVDQVSGIAALPLAVAKNMGLPVAYLPGLVMRRLADLYPGRDKTDPRDAFVIADAARTLPHTVRLVDQQETLRAEVAVLTGYDDDLVAEGTRLANDCAMHCYTYTGALNGSLGHAWAIRCSTF